VISTSIEITPAREKCASDAGKGADLGCSDGSGGLLIVKVSHNSQFYLLFI